MDVPVSVLWPPLTHRRGKTFLRPPPSDSPMLLYLVLASVAGAAASLLVVASAASLFRARLMRAVAANVRATVEATAGDLIKNGVEAIGKASSEAADSLTALKSERGRVMALLRHRGRVDEEEAEADEAEGDGGGDRLDRLLSNPILQGFLQQKGLDPSLISSLADGELKPEHLAALQQLQKPAAPAVTYL